MPRPYKYKTIREAAERNLYSKYGGWHTGLTFEEFSLISGTRCYVCHGKPAEELTVERGGESYTLLYNYVVNKEPICRMCRQLATDYGIDTIISHSARILAARMHAKRKNERDQNLS